MRLRLQDEIGSLTEKSNAKTVKNRKLAFSGRPERDSAAGTVLSSTREVESCPALRDLFGIYLEQPECSEPISIVPKPVLLRVSRHFEPSECRFRPGIPRLG